MIGKLFGVRPVLDMFPGAYSAARFSSTSRTYWW